MGIGVEKRTLFKTFPFKLMDKDYIEKGKLAATQQLDVSNIEEHFKDVKAEWKHKIKLSKQDLSHSLRIIRNGVEEREVEVEELKDFVRMTVTYILDGEILEERAMTDKERQLAFNAEQASKNQTDDNVISLTQEQRDIREVMKGEKNKKTKKDHLQ